METNWEKHELKILIEHHTQKAREMIETHKILGEDDDVPSKFVAFAKERNRRAIELSRKLAALEGEALLTRKRWPKQPATLMPTPRSTVSKSGYGRATSIPRAWSGSPASVPLGPR